MTPAQLISIRQIAKLGLIFIVVGVLVSLLTLWWGSDKASVNTKKTIIHSIPSVADNTDASDFLLHKFDKEMGAQNKFKSDFELKFAKQEALLAEQQETLNQLTKKLQSVTQLAQQQPSHEEIPYQELTSHSQQPIVRNKKGFSTREEVSDFEDAGNYNKPSIRSVSLVLSDKGKKIKNKDNYIPAGSFVPAIILGGVDASVGLTAQSDPRPILLKLDEKAILPNFARNNIRDCHIVGAAHGDISSERAYVRTEKISCTLADGKIFESDLKGYIAGEDGKDGIRGRMIRREGDLLWNSFFAGSISGLGKSASQALGSTSISPFGSTNTVAGAEVLKSGAYGGVGEGADRLEKYFIERAEQYQPIIQVAAGRAVTIVLTQGLSLDEVKG